MSELNDIFCRMPVLEDGMDVFRLVEACPPLDANSSYCNLLQCSHFSQTSVCAIKEGKLVGFVSGYIIPERPDSLFIWQVAVSEQARGCGLASRMLNHIIKRPHCQDIRYIETTITDSNKPSWALFKSFAKKHSTALKSSIWMEKESHFSGLHDSEALVCVGPLTHHISVES